MSYEDFCQQTYHGLYVYVYNQILNGRTSSNAKTAAEREAQKTAIKETLKMALERFPDHEAAELWRAIYVAHLKRKAGIADLNTLDEEVIQRVISADQSWKKASGHAFEAFIEEVANPELRQYGVKFVLQRELSEMIHNGEIHNDDVDMAWINQRIHTDVFDLYAISSWQNHNYVFGCIQSKTSIRDRVTRDREPSQQAMNGSFWSVAVALDGAFLALPKFQEMVNGGGEDYEENGWHGLYVMSDKFTVDRIYPVDRNLSLLVDHARQASEAFMRARLRLLCRRGFAWRFRMRGRYSVRLGRSCSRSWKRSEL